jgi:hypothetical protein
VSEWSGAIRRGGTAALLVATALLVAALGPGVVPARADLARVTGVTTQAGQSDVRIIVHVSAPVHYEIQRVRADWIVVDILGATLAVQAGPVSASSGPVTRIRLGQFAPTVVRVVVELAQPLKFRVDTAAQETTIVIALPSGAAPPAAGSPLPPGVAAPAAVSPPPPTSGGKIVFGHGIGRVHLGMQMADVVAALGAAATTTTVPGVGTEYRWYSDAQPAGFGVRATPAGIVQQLWIVGELGYRTAQGLHVGSTALDVRAALGPPSWSVAVSSQNKTTTLMYDRLGVWFVLRPDIQPTLPWRVARIDIVQPSTASPSSPTP